MNVAETINQKVIHLPPGAQEEVLELVEKIEVRYSNGNTAASGNGGRRHLFESLSEIQINGPVDLSARHDFYAHGKIED